MEQGERVRMYRLYRQMTQPELSAATGLPVPTISKIENGRKQLWLTEAVRVATALGVRVEDLAGVTALPEIIPLPVLAQEVDRLVTVVGESMTRLGALVGRSIIVTISSDTPSPDDPPTSLPGSGLEPFKLLPRFPYAAAWAVSSYAYVCA